MNRKIEVGSIVMVVKTKLCCGKGKTGVIFQVKSIHTLTGKCSYCGSINTMDVAFDTEKPERSRGANVLRLIKLSDPPSQLSEHLVKRRKREKEKLS